MESAAMDAYRRDVENNADLSSVEINRKLKEPGSDLSTATTSSDSGVVTKLWNEAKGRDGKSYYINIMTNERTKQAPSEGFLSVEEQRTRAEFEAKNQLAALEKYKQKEARLTVQELKQQEEEERARLAREKLKERRVKEDTPPPQTYGPLLEPGKTEPYGQWQTIQAPKEVDWQLPQQSREDYFAPVEYEPEPVAREFKEKSVGSIEGTETSFKKRKIPAGARRNTRQRLDND